MGTSEKPNIYLSLKLTVLATKSIAWDPGIFSVMVRWCKNSTTAAILHAVQQFQKQGADSQGILSLHPDSFAKDPFFNTLPLHGLTLLVCASDVSARDFV